MTFSEIKIKFNRLPMVGESIEFTAKSNNNSLYSQTIKEVFKNVRNTNNVAPIVTTVTQQTALCQLSLVLDYGVTRYSIDYVNDTIYIKSYDPNVYFIEVQSDAVTVTINNFQGQVLKVDNLQVLPSLTNTCAFVRYQLTTNIVAEKISGAFNNENNANLTFDFELPRVFTGQEPSIKLESIDGQKITKLMPVINVLNSDSLSLNIANSPNGATVTVEFSYFINQELKYSLDGVNWQLSNVFSGVPEGTKTIYVKDAYGCKISKLFSIEKFGITEPYFRYSKSNSIRAVKLFENGVNADKRIDENRLSKDDEVCMVYEETYRFKSSNVVTLQFKSNYLNIDVSIGGSNLLITKKSNNLRLKDRRDAFIYDYGNNQTGVYFLAGATYDFDTELNEGNYTLNGGLPEWAKIGEYIKVGIEWFKIRSIIPVLSKQAKVIVIDRKYNGTDTIEKVGCIYNRENYEVYEFSIDMQDYEDKEFNFTINNQDDNLGTLNYISEKITSKSDLKGFKEIIYFNDTNTDILYSTGIQHRAWVEFEDVSHKLNGEVDTTITDTRALLLNASVNDGKTMKLKTVTGGRMLQLYRTFLHRSLFIDGTQYIVTEKPSVEGRLDDSNLYVIELNLLKSNGKYKAKSYNYNEPNMSVDSVDLPNLLDLENTTYLRV